MKIAKRIDGSETCSRLARMKLLAFRRQNRLSVRRRRRLDRGITTRAGLRGPLPTVGRGFSSARVLDYATRASPAALEALSRLHRI